ncbi:MAG TPA: toll/interleukin-1 receptor domain-containing protein [Stellaceae bacterium]|nr:toll/interleukin-1 receptor domain-containing protein [Stellaceae bacterium]
MQALGPTTIFPCYAAADRELAAQVAGFLQKGADVRVFLEEGAMPAGGDLARKAREGRMAEIVVVLFSRDSLPPRWPRAQWEDALVNEPAAEGVRMAFLKCDDCNPPRVLANQFDLTGRKLDGLRALKRWVRGSTVPHTPPSAEVELLAIAVADRPGMDIVESAALAHQAMEACAADFDAVIRLHCLGRTLTALAGELAWELGLKLDRDSVANLERLESFCAARRLLIVLEAPGDEIAENLVFGGRCSTIISTEAGDPGTDPLHQAQRALNGGLHDWTELCRLARLGRQLTTNRGRIAECFELMQQWHTLAAQREDRDVANEAAREMVWILESWGKPEEAAQVESDRAREYDVQMKLF